MPVNQKPSNAGCSNFDTKQGETPALSSGKVKSPEQPETTVDKFPRNLELDWSKVTENYSTKQFTKIENKLVALQGLIDTVAAHTRWTPYFGMWKEVLFGGLLWEALRPSRRLNKHHAPSFSWASLDGLIKRLYSKRV